MKLFALVLSLVTLAACASPQHPWRSDSRKYDHSDLSDPPLAARTTADATSSHVSFIETSPKRAHRE
jgi:hypothetical protein